MNELKLHQAKMDIAIRQERKFYYRNNPNNTLLAISFNRLLSINGTYTLDLELNSYRESTKDVENWR